MPLTALGGDGTRRPRPPAEIGRSFRTWVSEGTASPRSVGGGERRDALADEEDLAGDVDREGPTRRGAVVVARDLRPLGAGLRDAGALEPLGVLVVVRSG